MLNDCSLIFVSLLLVGELPSAYKNKSCGIDCSLLQTLSENIANTNGFTAYPV